MDIKNIGKTIAEQRKKHNMSQKDLADILNVSNKTISKWECGNGIPDIECLDKLANAFGITLDEFLHPKEEIVEPVQTETVGVVSSTNTPISTTPTTKNKPKKLLLSLIISCSLVFATAASLLCYFFIPRKPEIVSTDKFYVDEQTAIVSCTVDNAIEQFSFSHSIEVPMTNKWNVYYDLNGLQVINSQTVNLQVGDNTFYIVVENSAGEKKTYQVIVRRKPLYVVTFNTNGGETIVNEIVMEDDFATYQEPVREGYIFNSWDFDFTQPITQDTTINATWIAKNLTINYYANNGTEATSTQAVTYDDTVSFKTENEFTKEGYTLSAWNTKADGSGTQYSVNQTFNNFQVSETDFDLYAQWTVNQYTVTATKNLQNAGTVNGTGSFDYGTVQTLSAITNTGYTWEGWYTKDNTLVTGSQTLTVTIGDEGQEYIAKWTANKYNVSLNVNGGNAISETKKELVFGDSYVLPIPTRTEAVFLGWFDIDNNKYTNNQGVSIENWGMANTVTLYAHYKINEYQVSLNENIDVGGAVIGAGLKEYDSNVTITAQPKAGYSFVGWYNGTTLVSSLEEYSFTMPNMPISYTAHWKANNYTVTMDVDGGVSLADNKKTVTFDDSYSLPVTSKTGYTFLGWCDEDGTQYTNAQGQSLFNWNVASDTLLIADYKINQYQMTVNKNIDKAGSVTGFGLKDYNSTVVLTATTNDGYSFTGWYSGNSLISELAVYSFEMPHYELSYTSKWKANDYTLTMDVNGGKELADDSKTVTYDSSYTLTVPEKDGYDFGGWYTGNYGTGTQLTDSSGNSVGVWNIADDTTVYAKWNAIDYAITYILNGGTNNSTNPSTYNIENPDIPLNYPTKTGYSFNGWVTQGADNAEKDLVIPAGSFGAKTFAASWVRGASFVPISTPQDLQNIQNNLSGKYYLTKDIDLTDFEWTPITNFAGVLDGNNKKILNFNLQLPNLQGGAYAAHIYGFVKENTGIIKNITFQNSTINISSNQSLYFGILAGENSGSIVNCSIINANIQFYGDEVGLLVGKNGGFKHQADGTSTWKGEITNCKVEGTILGTTEYAGGIAGSNSSEINNCISAAYLKVSPYFHIYNDSWGYVGHVGGIAGSNSIVSIGGPNRVKGYIRNCIFKGTIEGVQNAYGIAHNSGTIRNCISNGTLSGDKVYTISLENDANAVATNNYYNAIFDTYEGININGISMNSSNFKNTIWLKNNLHFIEFKNNDYVWFDSEAVWVLTDGETPKLYWEV